MIRQVVSGNRVLKLPDEKLLEAKTLTTGEINRNADGSVRAFAAIAIVVMNRSYHYI